MALTKLNLTKESLSLRQVIFHSLRKPGEARMPVKSCEFNRWMQHHLK